MTTQTTVTLTAETLPLFASKQLPNGEYIEVEADSPDANSYTIRRCWMGSPQWEDTAYTATDAISAVAHWGLDGWTPALHGEQA